MNEDKKFRSFCYKPNNNNFVLKLNKNLDLY